MLGVSMEFADVPRYLTCAGQELDGKRVQGPLANAGINGAVACARQGRRCMKHIPQVLIQACLYMWVYASFLHSGEPGPDHPSLLLYVPSQPDRCSLA